MVMTSFRGHTILEMLLVVSILAMIAAMNAPRFKSFALKKDAQRLTALMNNAQRQSVQNGCQYILNINSVSKSFCLKKYEEGAAGHPLPAREDACIRSLTLDSAVSMEAAVSQVIFYPDSHMTPVIVKLHYHDRSVVFSTIKQWGKVLMTQCAGDCHDI